MTITEAAPAFQKWSGHCKSRSLVHVQGGEGLQQATCGIKMRGCQCRPVGPRQAPDQPTKERERLYARNAYTQGKGGLA